MDKMLMLHHLRNPYGVADHEMRKARLFAADELERLYHMEKQFKDYINSLEIKTSKLLKD